MEVGLLPENQTPLTWISGAHTTNLQGSSALPLPDGRVLVCWRERVAQPGVDDTYIHLGIAPDEETFLTQNNSVVWWKTLIEQPDNMSCATLTRIPDREGIFLIWACNALGTVDSGAFVFDADFEEPATYVIPEDDPDNPGEETIGGFWYIHRSLDDGETWQVFSGGWDLWNGNTASGGKKLYDGGAFGGHAFPSIPIYANDREQWVSVPSQGEFGAGGLKIGMALWYSSDRGLSWTRGYYHEQQNASTTFSRNSGIYDWRTYKSMRFGNAASTDPCELFRSDDPDDNYVNWMLADSPHPLDNIATWVTQVVDTVRTQTIINVDPTGALEVWEASDPYPYADTPSTSAIPPLGDEFELRAEPLATNMDSDNSGPIVILGIEYVWFMSGDTVISIPLAGSCAISPRCNLHIPYKESIVTIVNHILRSRPDIPPDIRAQIITAAYHAQYNYLEIERWVERLQTEDCC